MKIKPLEGHRRILLKISGEFLKGPHKKGLCWETLGTLCDQIATLNGPYQWVIMVGGGNFFRGRELKGMCSSNTADALGMMSTYLNALALRDQLSARGCPCDLWTAHRLEGTGKMFNVHSIQQALACSEVVICGGGLGHGATSTDTAAFIRAYELECDLILKATNVDGIYAQDPKVHANSPRYERLSYGKALQENLKIMDYGALALGLEHKRPCIVFSLDYGLLSLSEGNSPYSVLHA